MQGKCLSGPLLGYLLIPYQLPIFRRDSGGRWGLGIADSGGSQPLRVKARGF